MGKIEGAGIKTLDLKAGAKDMVSSPMTKVGDHFINQSIDIAVTAISVIYFASIALIWKL